MKKILLLILTLFLFLSCYIIFQITENKAVNYVLIGDELVNNPYIMRKHNYKNNFVSNDYRIIDLIKIIKYNEEIFVDNRMVSIHQQLKNADILVISIGNREILDKLNDTTKDKYVYINKLIYNLRELFLLLNKYDYQQVYFLGYYNEENSEKELFRYLNMRVKKIAKDNQICFIDIEKLGIFKENSKIFELNDSSYKKIYNFIVENLEKC